jgi:hypothetical protein
VEHYIPTFVNQVTAKVDVLAIHVYSTCNQQDTDATISNANLANVPVWVLENNVSRIFFGNGIDDRRRHRCKRRPNRGPNSIGSPITLTFRGYGGGFVDLKPKTPMQGQHGDADSVLDIQPTPASS